MSPRNDPDSIQIAFDDHHRLVANAGLLLPVTLAHHLGLGELVDRHVDLGRTAGRANASDKMLTLVGSALAGGPPVAGIDDADALRAGGVGRVLGCAVKTPSTLGTFLRSFRWGRVRQLGRVSRELLAGVWATDAGPGDRPLTIDLDSHRRNTPRTHLLARQLPLDDTSYWRVEPSGWRDRGWRIAARVLAASRCRLMHGNSQRNRDITFRRLLARLGKIAEVGVDAMTSSLISVDGSREFDSVVSF